MNINTVKPLDSLTLLVGGTYDQWQKLSIYCFPPATGTTGTGSYRDKHVIFKIK